MSHNRNSNNDNFFTSCSFLQPSAKKTSPVLEVGFSVWTSIRKIPGDPKLFISRLNLLSFWKVKKTTPKEVQNMTEFAKGYVTSWYGYWLWQRHSPVLCTSQLYPPSCVGAKDQHPGRTLWCPLSVWNH